MSALKNQSDPEPDIISNKKSIAKILVIEDNEEELEMLYEILETNGFSPTKAASAQEGLIQVIGNRFDVALIDINLPDGNGLDLLKLFSVNYKHMSNIIITGQSTVESAQKAVILEADGYLLKPFDFAELEQLILKNLNKKKQKIQNEINQGELHALQQNKKREISLMTRYYKRL